MRRRTAFARLAVLSWVCVSSFHCAFDEPVFSGVIHKGDVSVRFGAAPSGWRGIRIDGADLAFRDDAHGGSVLVDVHCGERDGDAPLSVLTEHLIMGTTDRSIESDSTIPFDGREAMRTTLTAKLDGVPMRYDIFVMKKDGCVHDVVYVAPPAQFAEGDLDFQRFAITLHATSHGAGGRTRAVLGSTEQ